MVEIVTGAPRTVSFSELREMLSTAIGCECSRRRVGRGRSLDVGFGRRMGHLNTSLTDPCYADWEIGTWYSAWRILDADSQVLCGSGDAVDNVEELDKKVGTIDLGVLRDVSMLSDLDLELVLDNGVRIQFFGVSSDDDELFHVFGPSKFFAEYSGVEGWKVGRSDAPWK